MANVILCGVDLHQESVFTGKLKEWSLVLYGTSVHPYSAQKIRFPDSLSPVEEEPIEEYNGK